MDWRERIAGLHIPARAALFGLGSFLLAEAGNLIPFQAIGFSAFRPPTGLFVAALLLTGPKHWPWLLLAALPANIVSDLLHGRPLWASALFYAGNCLGALAGAGLVRRFSNGRPDMGSLKGVLCLLGLAGVLGSTASASVGALTALAAFGGELWPAWFAWWVGDALSVFLVAPLVLGLADRRLDLPREARSRLLAEASVVTLCVVVLGRLFYSGFEPLWLGRYLVIPLLVWAALRFGPRLTSATGLALAVACVWTASGRFALEPAESQMVQAASLQTFLAVVALTAGVLAAAMAERRGMERNLIESEAKFRLIYERSPSGIMLFDGQGVIVGCNQRFAEIIGVSAPEELAGFDMPGRMPEGPAREAVRRAIESGQGEFEGPYTSVSGGRRMHIRAMHREVRPGLYVGVFEDLTGRMAVLDALSESETKFRRVFEGVPAGIFLFDSNGVILEANPRLAEILGLPSAEAFRGFDILSQAPESPAKEALRAALRTDEADYEGPFVSALSGGRSLIRVMFRRITPDLFVALLEDLTERERMFAALAESEAKFRFLAENVADVISRHAEDGAFLYVSPNSKALSGYDPEELLGRPALDFVHPEDLPAARAGMEQALRTMGGSTMDFRVRRKDGGLAWVSGTCRAVQAEDGRIEFVTSLRDISERVRFEGELKRSLAEKEALLAEVHHRVKNNLQVVASLLDLARSRALSPEAIRALSEVAGKIQGMALIHNQLYRGGRFDAVDMAAYVRTLFEHLSRLFDAARITPTFDLQEISLSLDKALPLGLVLSEALTNVFKHAYPEGQGGPVEIRLAREGSGLLLVEVADRGRGFATGSGDLPTMGLKLLRNIVELQLKGELAIEGAGGTRLCVRFKP